MSAWMPGASRVQDFSGRYSGSSMTPVKILLHSTEGWSWPGYGGGASAPHLTVWGDSIRQHFPFNRSARALVNSSGGVETNTAGVIQIEIIGTCDPGLKARLPQALFVPEATADDIGGLIQAVRYLHNTYDIPVQDAAPRGWLSYPSSYGNKNGQRMTGAEWLSARGIVGHQHAPENSHGDPGNFPLHLLTGDDDMPSAAEVANAVLNHPIPNAMTDGKTNTTLYSVTAWSDAHIVETRRQIAEVKAVATTILDALGQIDGVDTEALKATVQEAVKDAVESVEAEVTLTLARAAETAPAPADDAS